MHEWNIGRIEALSLVTQLAILGVLVALLAFVHGFFMPDLKGRVERHQEVVEWLGNIEGQLGIIKVHAKHRTYTCVIGAQLPNGEKALLKMTNDGRLLVEQRGGD